MKFYAPKYKQLDLGLLRSSLDELDKKNRWVALGDLLPWTELEREYNSRLDNQKQGAGNKPARMILGAMIIKHKLNLSDAETIEIIRESPYMQYFCGLHGFTDKPIFDPSLFVTIRKRISEEELNKMTVKFLNKQKRLLEEKRKRKEEAQKNDEDPPTPKPKDSNAASFTDSQGREHKGVLKLDATCADAEMRYPVDVDIIHDGCRKDPPSDEMKSKMAKAIGERNEIECSFGTGKRIYRANDIRAKLPDTARCWTGMCYFVKNVMKFLRELCLALTEIWRFFIIVVAMRGYVCYPLSVNRK